MILGIFNIVFSLLISAVSNESEVQFYNYLKSKLPEYNRIEYRIIAPKLLELSSCKIDKSREIKISGNIAYLPVRMDNYGNKKNAVVTIKLKLFKDVWFTNRKIGKRENLSRYDFEIVEKEITELRFEPIELSTTIENFRSKFNIDEKIVLQKGMIEPIPEIEVGDRVKAIYSNKSVNIDFMVTARSEGLKGEIIKVKTDDKKIFKARIFNNDIVKIIE